MGVFVGPYLPRPKGLYTPDLLPIRSASGAHQIRKTAGLSVLRACSERISKRD